MTRGWMITLAAVTALAMVSTGAAQVAGPTVCNFTGTADFTPSVLRATPSPGATVEEDGLRSAAFGAGAGARHRTLPR